MTLFSIEYLEDHRNKIINFKNPQVSQVYFLFLHSPSKGSFLVIRAPVGLTP